MKRLAILFLLILAPLGAGAQSIPSFQGLWWKSPSGMESGWGINITHQGDILFATWFTYDHDGNGQWLVMPRGELQPMMMMGDYMDMYGMMGMPGMMGMGTMGNMGMNMMDMPTYTGMLYRTTGPSFDATTFDPASVTTTNVGYATFTFTDMNNGMFDYVLDGVYDSKPLTRETYAAQPYCDFNMSPGTDNFQDLWWRTGGTESGWGLNVVQQGDVVFATWFTYDQNGKGLWLVMPDAVKTASMTYQGKIYRTRGPAFDAAVWNNASVVATEMGTGTLAFTDANNGTFTAKVGTATIAKPISREVYNTPASVCR